MPASQKLTMVLHDIEDLTLGELTVVSKKVTEFMKHKEEKARFSLLTRNIDKDERWIAKIEQTVALCKEKDQDPTVTKLAILIKEQFGIVIVATHINSRLKSQNLLSETEAPSGKKRTITNEKSGEYGMYNAQRTLQNGEVYDAIFFSPKGVRFILEHIKDIVKFAQ